jgi:hypothetical protein
MDRSNWITPQQGLVARLLEVMIVSERTADMALLHRQE